MNSTLLKTQSLIHYHHYPFSRIPKQFTPFQLPIKKLQFSNTLNLYTTRIHPNNNSLTIEKKDQIFTKDSSKRLDFYKFGGLIKCGVVMGLLILGLIRCQKVLAIENGDSFRVFAEKGCVFIKGFWNGDKFLQVVKVFREQGLILAALLGLSAFFSLAETSITTLSPWKVSLCYFYVLFFQVLSKMKCYLSC